MIVAFLKSTDRLFTSPKLALFFSINGLFQKKELYTPVEDINFFEVDPPWISSQIYCNPPWNFPFFCIEPTNDFYSTPWNLFIDIINRGGGYNLFLEKPYMRKLRERLTLEVRQILSLATNQVSLIHRPIDNHNHLRREYI